MCFFMFFTCIIDCVTAGRVKEGGGCYSDPQEETRGGGMEG